MTPGSTTEVKPLVSSVGHILQDYWECDTNHRVFPEKMRVLFPDTPVQGSTTARAGTADLGKI